MRKYVTINFWDYASERAIKTIIQSLFVSGGLGAPLFALNWEEILSLSGGMGLASLLTSILFYQGDGSDNPNDTSVGIE